MPDEYDGGAIVYKQYKNGFMKMCEEQSFKYIILKKNRNQFLYDFYEKRWFVFCEKIVDGTYVDYWGDLDSKNKRKFHSWNEMPYD